MLNCEGIDAILKLFSHTTRSRHIALRTLRHSTFGRLCSSCNDDDVCALCADITTVVVEIDIDMVGILTDKA